MKTRIMTVDLEYDYETDKCESVNVIVPRLLDFFRQHNITATFFVLGRIAENYPQIVKQIAKEHEIASHCYDHVPLGKLSLQAQEEQLIKSKKTIEGLGLQCAGVRAPYFMIGKDHFEMIKKIGFKYDSSISTFFPGRYMHLTDKKKPFVRNGIIELPAPNWLPYFLPAGLSYYRFLYPLSKLFRLPYMLYFHPCEFLDAPIRKELPMPIRKVYARNQGENAWHIFRNLIENSKSRWVSCRQFIEKFD